MNSVMLSKLEETASVSLAQMSAAFTDLKGDIGTQLIPSVKVTEEPIGISWMAATSSLQ